MSAIAPGGTLLPLPREIRDEIYGHYFEKSYIVLRSYDEGDKHRENWCGYRNADLALLRTSKAINADVKHFLFSKAASKATTFRYCIQLHLKQVLSTPPAKEDTDRMMNVEFDLPLDEAWRVACADLDGYEDGSPYPAYRRDLLCEASIDRFVGTTVTRNDLRITIRLTFPIHSFLRYFKPFMKTRFFQTLESLNGFRRLALVLEWTFYNSRDRAVQDFELQKVVEEVQKELEPHLGPCTVKDATHSVTFCPDHYWDETDIALELQFQLYRFYDCRAEAAKLEK